MNDIEIQSDFFNKLFTFGFIPFSGYLKCSALCTAKPHLPTHLLHTFEY